MIDSLEITSCREITPTIVARRYSNGTVELVEFDAPKDETGVYGYIVRTSYRTTGGDWIRSWED